MSPAGHCRSSRITITPLHPDIPLLPRGAHTFKRSAQTPSVQLHTANLKLKAKRKFGSNPTAQFFMALIVNELVTNAVKYAFPDRADGHISVRLIRGPRILLSSPFAMTGSRCPRTLTSKRAKDWVCGSLQRCQNSWVGASPSPPTTTGRNSQCHFLWSHRVAPVGTQSRELCCKAHYPRRPRLAAYLTDDVPHW